MCDAVAVSNLIESWLAIKILLVAVGGDISAGLSPYTHFRGGKANKTTLTNNILEGRKTLQIWFWLSV